MTLFLPIQLAALYSLPPLLIFTIVFVGVMTVIAVGIMAMDQTSHRGRPRTMRPTLDFPLDGSLKGRAAGRRIEARETSRATALADARGAAARNDNPDDQVVYIQTPEKVWLPAGSLSFRFRVSRDARKTDTERVAVRLIDSPAVRVDLYGASLIVSIPSATERPTDRGLPHVEFNYFSREKWYGLVIVWDSTEGVMDVYLNGVFTKRMSFAPWLLRASSGPLLLGGRARDLRVSIDSVLVYPGAMTENQVVVFAKNQEIGRLAGEGEMDFSAPLALSEYGGYIVTEAAFRREFEFCVEESLFGGSRRIAFPRDLPWVVEGGARVWTQDGKLFIENAELPELEESDWGEDAGAQGDDAGETPEDEATATGAADATQNAETKTEEEGGEAEDAPPKMGHSLKSAAQASAEREAARKDEESAAPSRGEADDAGKAAPSKTPPPEEERSEQTERTAAEKAAPDAESNSEEAGKPDTPLEALTRTGRREDGPEVGAEQSETPPSAEDAEPGDATAKETAESEEAPAASGSSAPPAPPGNAVLWSTRMQASNTLIEIEFSPRDANEGEIAVLFAMADAERGSVFEFGLQRRGGRFERYVKGQLHGYAAVVWSAGKGKDNPRQSVLYQAPTGVKIATGVDRIAGHGEGPHLIRILKTTDEIRVESRGRTALLYRHDVARLGPLMGRGHIGVWQSSRCGRVAYSRLRVWQLKRK